MRFVRTILLTLLALCAAGCGPTAPAAKVAPVPQGPLDWVIEHGRVIDPETGRDGIFNVGIRNGVIVHISAEPLEGAHRVDATGLVVAPGFIDVHAHGPNAENYALRARDGVTTALELEIGTADVDRFYEERRGAALIHYGVSVGHVPVRMAVLGDPPGFLPAADAKAATHAADDAELVAIQQGVAKGLAAGALAVGFGIQYTPAASRWEVVQVFREAARAEATVHVHLRHGGTKEPESSTNALEEVLAAAVVSRAPLHVVHLHSTSLASTVKHLGMIDAAHAFGLDVTTECYPYNAGMTDIASGVFDPGWQEAMSIDFDDLVWAATGEHLTAETFAMYRAQGGLVAVFSIPEEAIVATLRHPLALVASDALMNQGKGHPRSAGTNARLLGHYVREKQILSLPEALRKITLMPAQRLERRAPSFKKKGRVQVGADADLTLFDPKQVQDRASWAEPTLPPKASRTSWSKGHGLFQRVSWCRESFQASPLARRADGHSPIGAVSLVNGIVTSWLSGTHFLAVLVSLALCRLPVEGAQSAPRPVGVVDLHADLSYQINYKGKNLATGSGEYLASELLKSGVEGVVLPLFIPRDVSKEGPRLSDLEASYQAMKAALAKTQPYSLPGSALPGRVRTWFSFEGSAPLADPAVNVEQWLTRGLALFGLVHTHDNVLATSAGAGARVPEAKAGLLPAGKLLVQRLLQQRALVDVSHASDLAAREIIALAEKAGVPVVASHSNARALAEHARNLSDDLARGIAKTGGVIGVNFHTPFLTRGAAATLDDVVKHIRYLVAKVGADHVAIGSDFEGGIRAARDLGDVRGFQKLARGLEAAGLPATDVRKVMGQNALRLLCSGANAALRCQ